MKRERAQPGESDAKRTAPDARPDGDLEVPFSHVREKLRDVLEREGVAIVTDVIEGGELREMEQAFVSDLAALVDDDALRACDDPRVQQAYDRYKSDGLRAFPHATARQIQRIPGFVLQGCVAAGHFAWSVRRHPRVHAAFAALFPEDAGPLVSSIDVTFFEPEGGPAHDVYDGSAHADQNGNDTRAPNLGDCSVYQGILYVWPAGDGCTTTCVWPGSHRSVWPRMMADASFVASGTRGDHYCEVKELQDATLREELLAGWCAHSRKLTIPAGALLLWNSRTVHTGWKGGPRFAQAVCLEPARERPAAQRLAKLRLAALGLPSTHWARIGHQHDVLPSYTGWLEATPAASACGHDEPSEVVLPLRAAIRPAALAEGADLGALSALAQIDWTDRAQCTHHCVWQPPEDDKERAALLEASVREEFKPFL